MYRFRRFLGLLLGAILVLAIAGRLLYELGRFLVWLFRLVFQPE